MRRVAVVGAGVSGLAAAHRLRTLLGPSAVITVLEQRDRVGGVLRTVDLAGVPYDVGAEAFLARRPEMPALLAELGLSAVHPTGASASVRAAGRTGPLPGATLLGVPTSAARLDGLLSAQGVAAVAAEPARPLSWDRDADVALGGLLRERFGDELADRLADPLLGGVYAGRVDHLGVRATIPALVAALDAGAPSLTAAADRATAPPPIPPPGSPRNPGSPASRGVDARESRLERPRVDRSDTPSSPSRPASSPFHPASSPFHPASSPSRAPSSPSDRAGSPSDRAGSPSDRASSPSRAASSPDRPPPVFGAVLGGYGALLDALVAASGAQVRLGVTVRSLERTAGGWRLTLGPTTDPEPLDVDAVVLAVPAPAAARLLADVAPAAARAAEGVELASSVVVALAYRPQDAAGLPPTSGMLVAAGEPLSVKGVTHSTNKWAHLSPDGLVRLRASLGRFGEAATLQVDDDELVARTRRDLAEVAGLTAAPVAVHVQRWGGGLPQYGVGHLDRVRALEGGLPAGLAVAGAALHGVGVPACVGTARAAAERVAAGLDVTVAAPRGAGRYR